LELEAVDEVPLYREDGGEEGIMESFLLDAVRLDGACGHVGNWRG